MGKKNPKISYYYKYICLLFCYSVIISAVLIGWFDSEITNELGREIEIDNRRPCRVLVQNKVDFHHEVIESTVLRFPLPWHEFNCTTSKSVIYDFALYQNRFHLNVPVEKSSLSRKAKHLNETEFWGWKSYFEKNLQYRTFDRKDGSTVPTKAYFNNLVLFKELKLNRSKHDAFIDVSCDVTRRLIPWLQEGGNRYCVLHGSNSDVLPMWPQAYNRSCFLSPMWPEHQCKFTAADLPKFGKNDKSDDKQGTETRICVPGGNRKLSLAAEIFSKIPFREYNATLYVSGRLLPRLRRKLQETIASFGIESHVVITSEVDYIKYHKRLSRCDIILPLTDPLDRPSHYPWNDKKSSGVVPALVAYKIPAVAHKEFVKNYRHVLSAPLEEYDDTTDSKVEALKRMLLRVHEKNRAS